MKYLLKAFCLACFSLFFGFTSAALAIGEPPVLMISDPAAYDELDERPGWVTLAFDQEIDPESIQIEVVDATGENKAIGDRVRLGSNVMVQLSDELPKGTYTVIYKISHTLAEPTIGDFQFAYGPGTWASPPTTTPADAAESPTPQVSPTDNQPSLSSGLDAGLLWAIIGAVAVAVIGTVSFIIYRRNRPQR